IGVVLGLWLFSMNVSKKSMLWILDKVVVPTALAASFIRIGNLMNSEILGKNADISWGFLFVRADGPDALPRHPVQLYESVSYLLLFIALYLLYWKTDFKKKPGFMFGVFMAVLWSIRFVMEYFKESQGGFESAFNNILSTGQLLSIPFVLIGLFYVLRPMPAGVKGS
ncbi:MAG: prolipoprotein diacylglyceryl transferase, partial [Haliscomenobacter sp.]